MQEFISDILNSNVFLPRKVQLVTVHADNNINHKAISPTAKFSNPKMTVNSLYQITGQNNLQNSNSSPLVKLRPLLITSHTPPPYRKRCL